MGLVKRKQTKEKKAVATESNLSELLSQLDADSEILRRTAARELSGFSEAANNLCIALERENAEAVRHAILTSLVKINDKQAAGGLIPFLRSEDAALRNAVIEALQEMPDEAAPHVKALLSDADSDVRIFAIDIVQSLCNREAPEWLGELIETESHVNVCSTAVDRLAEIGTPEMIPALKALVRRFPGEPFMEFAVKTAIARIEGSAAQ